MRALLFYSVLSAALFYLASRAMITSWLWKRYPPSIARFFDCAACTGFWFGFWLSLVFGDVWGQIFTVGMQASDGWRLLLESVLTGLVTMITTPIVAAIQDQAMQVLGSTVPEEMLVPSDDNKPDSPS